MYFIGKTKTAVCVRKNRFNYSSVTQRFQQFQKKPLIDKYMKEDSQETRESKNGLQRNKSDPTARFHPNNDNSLKSRSSTQTAIKLAKQLYSKKGKNLL